MTAGVPFESKDSFFEQVHQAQFERMPSGYRKLTARTRPFEKDRFEFPWMPHQEPGMRPSAALPYELAASGVVARGGKRLEIVLEAGNETFGKPPRALPFMSTHLGNFAVKSLRTRAYAVSAGDRVTDSWELDGFEQGIYHLRVCGPNGFLREFAGSADDPRVEIQCEYARRNNASSRRSRTARRQSAESERSRYR